jgi:predicted ATP-dependent endonuclease of OLD family
VRISSVHIRGYRCIANLDVPFDELTAFVGAGGVGKSTILNAINWFFAGAPLDERDRHWAPGAEEPVNEVVVAVTFTDLTPADREVLRGYAAGEETTLTCTYSETEGVKLSGNAYVFPPFIHVRDGEKAADVKSRYQGLCDENGEELGLPTPASSAQVIRENMEQWEREHTDQCELRSKDARHLHGAVGSASLASRFRYVLVRANELAAEALGDGRGTALNQLLSAVEALSEAKKQEIAELQYEAQGKIEKLIKEARGRDLVTLSTGLTKRVEQYFPGAKVKLVDEVESPHEPAVSVHAQVSDHGGHPVDPDMQGHGLQRALVIALLHELADAAAREATQSTVDEGEEQTADPPALMLAIEEPELYQHPLQARTLAASLATLADAASIQVAYSTHSAYFASPALFGRLRLCRRGDAGGTTCIAAEPDKIEVAIADAGYSGDVANKVAGTLALSLREAIFARSVLLTEGPTDTAMLHGVADGQGGLDREGIAVADCGTKSNLGPAIVILKQLGIPFFVLFDGDADDGSEDSKDLNRRLLALCEEPVTDWPDRVVRQHSASFKDNLETDLAALWPSYEEARERIAAELGVKDSKKDPRAYRDAVASSGEPPDFVVAVLDAARKLAA